MNTTDIIVWGLCIIGSILMLINIVIIVAILKIRKKYIKPAMKVCSAIGNRVKWYGWQILDAADERVSNYISEHKNPKMQRRIISTCKKQQKLIKGSRTWKEITTAE